MRLGTPAWFLEFPLNNYLALSPDGRFVAHVRDGSLAAFSSGERADVDEIRIIDVATDRELRRFQVHGLNTANAPLFTPDGRFVALVVEEPGEDSAARVEIWDVATGRSTRMLTGIRSGLHALAISKNGSVVADARSLAGEPLTLSAWDVVRGRQVGTMRALQTDGYLQVAVSASGQFLASWISSLGQPSQADCRRDHYDQAQIWQVASGKEVARLRSVDAEIGAVCFGADEKSVTLAGVDGTIQRFDARSGAEISRRHIGIGEDHVNAFSHDAKLLVTSTLDGKVTVWDATRGQRLGGSQGPYCQVQSVIFTGTRVLVCGTDWTGIHVWDACTGEVLNARAGHRSAVCALAFTPDDRDVLSASFLGDVCRWHLPSGARVWRQNAFRVHEIYAESSDPPNCALSAVGDKILAVERPEDREPCVVELPAVRAAHRFAGGPAGARQFAYAPDGEIAAVAATDAASSKTRVAIWNVRTGALVRELAIGFPLGCLVLSDGGRTVAATIVRRDAENHDVCGVDVWETATGKRRWRFPLGEVDRRALAVDADGTALAAVNEEGRLCVWDLKTGTVSCVLEAPEEDPWRPTYLLFSPDGRSLAVALCPDAKPPEVPGQRIRVYEVTTGKLRVEFSGQIGRICSLCFAHDGKLLASGSIDTTVVVWDLTQGRPDYSHSVSGSSSAAPMGSGAHEHGR